MCVCVCVHVRVCVRAWVCTRVSATAHISLLTAQQSVKDVLQSLVDDAMVDTDRIGTSNYFWALPSKAANAVSRPLSSRDDARGTGQDVITIASEKS